MPTPTARAAPNYGSFAAAPPARNRTMYNRFGNAFAGLRSRFGNAGTFLHKRLLGTRNQKEGSGRRKFLGRVFNKARSLTRRGVSAARGARYGFKRGSTMRNKFSRALFGARHGYRGAVVASPLAKARSAVSGKRGHARALFRAKFSRGALARGRAAGPPAAAAVIEAVEELSARPSARAQANVVAAIASSPPRAAAAALTNLRYPGSVDAHRG